MKVAVVGSRSITNINISKYIPKETSEIITGGAKGIGSLAEKYAQNNNIPIIVIKPEYSIYKKGAPLIRNKKIVELSDFIVAIWDGKSRETKYTIDFAKNQ